MIPKPQPDIDVVFAMPSSHSTVCVEGHNAAIYADRILVANGIRAEYIGIGGDLYLSKVRSKIASMFLDKFPKAGALFFVDDDVGFNPNKPLEYIRRSEDIVAGMYPKKMESVLEFPMVLGGDINGNLVKNGNYIRARMAPTGFMRIKRHVLEKIAETCDTFLDTTFAGEGLTPYREIFQMGRGQDGGWYGEDVSFCHHCAQLGFQIWVDTDHPMTHRGTKIWQANLGDHMKQFEELARKNAAKAREVA